MLLDPKVALSWENHTKCKNFATVLYRRYESNWQKRYTLDESLNVYIETDDEANHQKGDENPVRKSR